jgi:catechol 2,3-dioxygenase-like lactoylglutathione lyase family enzyme
MHSVQMVMLTAPELREAAAFYVEHLGFRATAVTETEAVVEGYGMQLVFSPGPGGAHSSAPAPERAAIEIPSTMPRIEALWERDRARDPDVLGPLLDASGAFVYVTLDPARNAVALVAPLPSERESVPAERVTQKLTRPAF